MQPVLEFSTARAERSACLGLSENQLIYDYFKAMGSAKSVMTMIDVGANFGGTMMPFLRDGWDVWAFEPDLENRKRLFERLVPEQTLPRRIDHRAVDKTSGRTVSFYRSPKHSGISSLSSFHSTHELAGTVETVSLGDFLNEQRLGSVDYLKIDVEGHDLFALQGFPFEQQRPAVVLAEYEDRKTIPLGYQAKDIADHLARFGYHVYISEWHPVVEYGSNHDWCCLRSYNNSPPSSEGWGNVLAFDKRPPDSLLYELATAATKERSGNGTLRDAPKTHPEARNTAGPAGDSDEPVGVSREQLSRQAAENLAVLERLIEMMHALMNEVETHVHTLRQG